MSFADKIRNAVRKLIPTEHVGWAGANIQPPSMLSYLTADKMASIIQSAENGDTRDLFTLYRDVLVADSHLQAEMGKRLLAVLGNRWQLIPADEESPADKLIAEKLKAELDNVPKFTDACVHLAKASIWPLSVCQKTYRPNGSGGFQLATLRPVDHTLLDYSTGEMRIGVPDKNGNVSEWDYPDTARYMIHRGHLLSSPDNWGGPMRSLLYWFLLGSMGREWWGRFLDRFGNPFIVGYFDREDTATRKILERSINMSNTLGGLVVNREARIELQQAAVASTGEAFDRFIDVCQKEKSKLILGQTLSATADSTGMGSGVADLQGDVRNDIRQWDAMTLGETLREQWFKPWMRYNGYEGSAPHIKWGTDEVNAQQIAAILESLQKAGIELTDDSLAKMADIVGSGLEFQRGGEIGSQSKTDPAPQLPANIEAEVADVKATLNGAQIKSLVEITESVSTGVLPKDAAIQIIVASFPFDTERAARILESVEEGSSPATTTLARLLLDDPNQVI